jgi:hypothetical protein
LLPGKLVSAQHIPYYVGWAEHYRAYAVAHQRGLTAEDRRISGCGKNGTEKFNRLFRLKQQ